MIAVLIYCDTNEVNLTLPCRIARLQMQTHFCNKNMNMLIEYQNKTPEILFTESALKDLTFLIPLSI